MFQNQLQRIEIDSLHPYPLHHTLKVNLNLRKTLRDAMQMPHHKLVLRFSSAI